MDVLGVADYSLYRVFTAKGKEYRRLKELCKVEISITRNLREDCSYILLRVRLNSIGPSVMFLYIVDCVV
jgi:hypothetical protein